MESWMEWLNFIDLTIVDLFSIYKSDNDNIAYTINRLWRYPQSLIGKKDIVPCA